MGDGREIDVFQFAAHRHAARQPRDMAAARAQGLAQRMRSGLAFGREAEREDHLLQRRIGGPFRAARPRRCRARRRRRAATAAPSARSTGRGSCRCARVPPGRPGFRRRTACWRRARHRCTRRTAAVSLKVWQRWQWCTCATAPVSAWASFKRAVTVVLQQVKGHALRRLDAHAGQPAQGVDEGIERRLSGTHDGVAAVFPSERRGSGSARPPALPPRGGAAKPQRGWAI